MNKSDGLPDNTLTTAEMPDFYRAAPYIVFRDFGGKLAHIYTLNMKRSLCKRHVRVFTPTGYAAGHKTCKRCLVIYRNRTAENGSVLEC